MLNNQLLIIERFIKPDAVELILDYAKSTSEYRSVLNSEPESAGGFKSINISKKIQQMQIPSQVASIFSNFSKVVNENLRSLKYPELTTHIDTISISKNSMNYHADAEDALLLEDRKLGKPNSNDHSGYNPPRFNEWILNKTAVRIYTTILYLNDDFDGGETTFPTKNIDIKPKKSRLIGFPCSRDYIHGVRPINNGVRFAVASWYQADLDASNRFFQQKDWN